MAISPGLCRAGIPQAGDIAACFGADLAGRLISAATSSPFAPYGLRFAPSHVAIILPWRSGDGERLAWYESTTLCADPCLFAGGQVSGVQVHDIAPRVADYTAAGGRVDLYRLQGIDRLDDEELLQLGEWLLRDFLTPGLGYDYREAGISGTRLWSRLRWTLTGADRESLFCSELIAYLLQRLGRLNRVAPALYNPGRLLRELVRTGVYRRHVSIQ